MTDRGNRIVRVLSIVGLISGVAAVIAIIVVGDTYGVLGSADYRIYESFNRVMAILLALEACSLIAFRVKHGGEMGRIDRVIVAIALIAWVGTAIGTGAEFWLYSDLPYGVDNLRNVAFGLFAISSLIAGLALLALGVRTLVGRRFSPYFGIILILYLPVVFVLLLSDQSIILAPALISMAIAALAMRDNRASIVPGL